MIDATHPQPQNPAENFGYDPVGNRTTSQSRGTTRDYSYDNMNRLLGEDQYGYSYDANGNMTSKVDNSNGDTTTYEYDSENRLIQVTTPTSILIYLYDGIGRRVAKTINGVVTKYVYDEKDIILELDENEQIKASYTRTLEIDELISVDRDTTGDGTLETTYFYHRDGLGSITAMTDSSGAVAQTYVYDSFGNIKSSTGSVENEYTYTSREWDAEAELYYYRARHYDANAGRFLQEDPIAFAGGINFYAYVNNNPVNYIDPLGLLTWGDIKKYGKCVGECVKDSPNYKEYKRRMAVCKEALGICIEGCSALGLPQWIGACLARCRLGNKACQAWAISVLIPDAYRCAKKGCC